MITHYYFDDCDLTSMLFLFPEMLLSIANHIIIPKHANNNIIITNHTAHADSIIYFI